MKIKTILAVFCVSAFTVYFSNLSNNQSTQLVKHNSRAKIKETLPYDKPDEAVAWLEQFRHNKDKTVSKAQLNQRIVKETLVKESARKIAHKGRADEATPLFRFENLGPSNFGGRIRGFVIKPDNDNYLLAGSVSGGIFKSTDAAASWHPVTDFLPSIAIGSMISDPDNSNRVFAGTGEGFFNVDSAQGAGIFVSQDFGDTWQQLASTDNENFYFVNRLVRVPSSDILIAATRKGIFRSTNLGQSWTEVSNIATTRNGFVDMKLDPSNANNILAVHYGNANDALTLNIASPSSIAGDYVAVLANFGPSFPTNGINNKNLLLVSDGVAPSNDGCEAISTNLSGKIALIQRGKCNFTVKVKNAQLKGAVAVIVYQNTDASPFAMGGDDTSITIPSAMISKSQGEAIAAITSTINSSIFNAIRDPIERFLVKSTDAGATWQRITASNGAPVSSLGRMEVAFGNDGVVYISASNSESATLGLWRADSINAQFHKTTSNTAFIERQGWYDLAIAVDPNNSDKVLLGAVDQFVTTNKGQTIGINSYWSPDGTLNQVQKHIHSDHHGIYYSNSNVLYVMSDGGVYKSSDGGQTYNSANNGLTISQSYGIAVRKDGKRLTSGTQDNGAQLYFGDKQAWLEWQGGDGGYSGWDQQNSNYVYGSYVRGAMYGSNNGGFTVSQITLPDTDGARFIQPFVLDNNNGNRMLVGTDNVFYSNNIRQLDNATFTDVSGAIGSVTAVNFNAVLSSQVFAGTSAGNVFKIDALGTSNNLSDISPNNVSGAITDIKADTNDASGKTLYLTRGDYDNDRILKSTNGGVSWSSLQGDLPQMPLYQVSIDPTNPNQIYVGSELGLWTTRLGTGAPHWVRYDYGLAFTRVMDLVWNNDNTLFVGTHGRGTYKASRGVLEISLNKFVTTDSNHDDDAILDRGESGLLMINVKNPSSFALENTQLSISQQGINVMDSMPITVGTVPAYSSKVVPVKVSLANDAACLSDNVLDIYVSYSNGISHAVLHLPTAANKTSQTGDFLADAESEDIYMSHKLMLGTSDWQKVSTAANSGAQSWFTTDESLASDKSLISPWLVMDAGGNRLTFALKYFTEISTGQIYDGAMLEIREKDGLWHDIGSMSSVAYDGPLHTNNTAQTRKVWGGAHNQWRNASVDLGESYKGKTIQFRFRMISDSNTGASGFWLDDIKMTNVIWDKALSCDDEVSTGGKIPNSGLWYDRGRNGHGFVVEPIGDSGLYFTVFYTYDDNGKPEWYTSLTTLENGVLNANFDNGTLQRFIYDFINNTNTLDSTISDGRLSIDFNSDAVANAAACQDGVQGRDASTVAVAHWKINDQEGQWCINPIIAQANKGYPDFGGTWYAGTADSGWGLSVALAKQQLISIIYYYDQTGQPRWAIGDVAGFQSDKEMTLNMQEASGFGRLDTPITPTYTEAGTLKLNLSHVLNNLEIDGKTTVDIEYQGTQAGQWSRTNTAIQILTNAH